jgi:hypothetical protein
MTDWMDYYCDFSSQEIGNRALALYQSHRSDRNACETLLDEFFCGPEYVATIEAVRNAMREGVTMSIDQIEDVGNLTVGLKDNAKDVCDLWMKRPLRRVEFGEQEIRDIREAVLGLWTILREIEKAEAA